ncbi:MAG: tRNA adenosine(34) deaminase TadA [Candidatus Latescibacterota bacterium]|jgi:tRNA(adenine34) deaminase
MVDAPVPDDVQWMQEALIEAREAGRRGEVPVGAVVVAGGQVLARGRNETQALQDPTAHAELLAIRRAAAAVGSWRLPECTLYASLEPCAMCGGAIVLARLVRVVFAARDPKGGACGSLRNVVQDQRLNHWCELSGGVLERESAELLRGFFAAVRAAS